MAAIAVQTPTPTGRDITADWVAATVGGDTMANDGRTRLFVKTVGTACTVTITSQQNCNQGANHPLTVAITTNKEYAIGPFDQSRFNDPATGLISIAYSAVTAVTVRAERMP
jgi:hypothetical protein